MDPMLSLAVTVHSNIKERDRRMGHPRAVSRLVPYVVVQQGVTPDAFDRLRNVQTPTTSRATRRFSNVSEPLVPQRKQFIGRLSVHLAALV